MPKCHKFYPKCLWTVTHFWSDLALDTILLTQVFWSYSTQIVRVCFTPLLQSTIRRDLKRKRNFQINFSSPAMTRLYELLCYHYLEHLDPKMHEFLPFIHTTRSPLHSFLLLPLKLKQQTTLSTFPKFYDVFFTKVFGICYPNTTEYFQRRGLVTA